jgi:hypothetical protein
MCCINFNHLSFLDHDVILCAEFTEKLTLSSTPEIYINHTTAKVINASTVKPH